MENETNPDSQLKNRSKKNRVWLIALILLIAFIAIGYFAAGFFKKDKDSTEDTIATKESTELDNPVYDPIQYSWSTMNEGPYNDKISFATSTDLLNWTDSGQTLAEHVSVPDVIIKDGTLYVYFVDVSTDGYPEKLGLIRSTDNGKTWADRDFINIKGIGQKAAVDPAPFLLDDGRIRLYYFDIAEARNPKIGAPSAKNKIYSAISNDGVNFVEEDEVRFEYDGIFDPSIIKVSDSLWRMYVGNQDGRKVYSAISTDGLEFTYEGIAYSGGAIPNVIYENNTYYLFTGGIEISTSKDGKSFIPSSDRFVIPNKITADPGVVKIGPNNYLMVYKTKEMNKGAIPPTER